MKTSATSAMSRDAKIVVVGAGFAGLAAANSLVKAGFQNVKILEAKDRLGGRVGTIKPFTENIIELGANWIHGQKGNPLYELAKKHNLLAEKAPVVEFEDYYYREGGKHLSYRLTEGVTELFEKLLSKAHDDKLPDKYKEFTLGDYLDAAFAESSLASSGDGARILEWCKRNECISEACSSLFDVSAFQMSEFIDLEGEFYNTLGPGGYQAILNVLLEIIPPEMIISNSAVKKIQWDLEMSGDKTSGHPVKVICENEQVFEADHVIVTVSLGVLKKQGGSLFEPALPKTKLDAIEKLGFGIVDKIFLSFSKKFWPDDCEEVQLVWDKGPEDREVYDAETEGDSWKKTWFKKITGFESVARHPTVLCGWITGKEALYMETLQDSEIVDTCLGLLRSFTGWSVPNVSKVLITRWGHDPQVSGSYSYIPKGVNGQKNQKILAAPLFSENKASQPKSPQVLFAGEATNDNFYATTHGAYMSGIREAERLIKHYSN